VRTSIRRASLVAGVLLAGVVLGRFVVPRLEARSEITAIVRSSRGRCSFATSTTTFLLGRPRDLIDGGMGLACGERRQMADGVFLYCECE